MVGTSGRLVSLRTRVKEFDAMVADGEFGQCRENRVSSHATWEFIYVSR